MSQEFTDGRVSIKLGEDQYVVEPQPLGYVLNELGSDITKALQEAAASKEPGHVLGKQAYAVLHVLLPGQNLMPEYKFQGFATQKAFEAGEYDREHDQSPTGAQVSHALAMVGRVNAGEGADFLKGLTSAVAPELLQQFTTMGVAWLAEQMQDEIPKALEEAMAKAEATSEDSSTSSASSQQPSGESARMSSGNGAQTSREARAAA
jgi:hypothetical protein